MFHKVRKNTNGKNISDNCTNDEIPECKCVNSPIKDDIALYKNNNYNQNTDEDSNNLSSTSINNYKTSENNVVRTTETPNNKTAPTRKKKFQTNTTSLKLGSTETELNKRKYSSPIIREIDTPVGTKTVSSKTSRVDFDIVIDKPSKQESHRS